VTALGSRCAAIPRSVTPVDSSFRPDHPRHVHSCPGLRHLTGFWPPLTLLSHTIALGGGPITLIPDGIAPVRGSVTLIGYSVTLIGCVVTPVGHAAILAARRHSVHALLRLGCLSSVVLPPGERRHRLALHRQSQH
jgi:hypothetical protein